MASIVEINRMAKPRTLPLKKHHKHKRMRMQNGSKPQEKLVKLVIKKVMVVKKSRRSRSKVTTPNRLLRLPATLIILIRTKLLV